MARSCSDLIGFDRGLNGKLRTGAAVLQRLTGEFGVVRVGTLVGHLASEIRLNVAGLFSIERVLHGQGVVEHGLEIGGGMQAGAEQAKAWQT